MNAGSSASVRNRGLLESAMSPSSQPRVLPFHVRRTILKAPRGLVKALIQPRQRRTAAIFEWVRTEFGDRLETGQIRTAHEFAEGNRNSVLAALLEERDELRAKVITYDADVKAAVACLNIAYSAASKGPAPV